MVSIRVEGLCIQLGEFDLKDVTFEVAPGEYFVLLGPTGAGKTVLIECIAGLHQPAQGRIFLGEREVTHLKPEERDIGYVPQDYALFPHMTVKRNIAFGLRVRRIPRDEIERRIAQLTELLNIEHLLSRYPLTLSGGEKQRVALARALAVHPKVLLLDEPLAAVDESTRERLCIELRDIQRRTGVTVIHVSHNFEETLAVADRIGVMNAGCMVQVGAPEEIFYAPRDPFVAEFTRAENVFAITGEPKHVACGFITVHIGDDGVPLIAVSNAEMHKRTLTHVMVRPEAVRLVDGEVLKRQMKFQKVQLGNIMRGKIARLTDRGTVVRVEVIAEGNLRWAVLLMRSEAQRLQVHEGKEIFVAIEPANVHLL